MSRLHFGGRPERGHRREVLAAAHLDGRQHGAASREEVVAGQVG